MVCLSLYALAGSRCVGNSSGASAEASSGTQMLDKGDEIAAQLVQRRHVSELTLNDDYVHLTFAMVLI